MKTFLQMVAQDLHHKLGNDLSRTAIVFPNKRARLFFDEYLAAETDRPLWSPAYVTISELFQQLSPWTLGDPIALICELYKVFCKETQSEETLDDFYFWGELLISDFDDADKNRVDTTRLFSNLKDLRALMDDSTFLDEEQEAAIQQFFQHFSIEKRTVLKEKFISLWDKLGDIYAAFRRNLANQGMAYEGMMYRQIMEEFPIDRLVYERYIFVGFNVLNKVEHDFFLRLQEAGKAWFYWDYDTSYVLEAQNPQVRQVSEAGEFIIRNLKDFPNQLPASCFDVMRQPKRIRYISAPTENAQARYISQWWKDEVVGGNNSGACREKENAVVLCNESLLLPVLHSLPDDVKNINVTMGFPLSQTPVFSFIHALIELQTTGYESRQGYFLYDAVLNVLKHAYTRRLTPAAEQLEQWLVSNNRFYPLPSELKKDEWLEKIFTPQSGNLALCNYLTERIRDVSILYRTKTDNNDIFNQLYQESLFKSFTLINRLAMLVEKGDLTLRSDTFKRLLDRLLSSASIPFHGEPAIGMQIMGVLETRNLDFRNLILLSVNEGQLPKAGGDSSFIPYNLRKAFGMTTIEHKNAVYAYYFYRLIQRANSVTLLYNTSSDGLNRGEMSRFMLQYLVESGQEITHQYLEAGQKPRTERRVSISKDDSLMKKLYQAFDIRLHPNRVFSPSALNTYLDCRLKFYFRFLKGLKPVDEVSAEIDSALFGTIFHKAAECIYRDWSAGRNIIEKQQIADLLRNDVKLQNYVDNAFKEEFFHIPIQEKAPYNGTQLIHAKVIGFYLKQLLRHDLQYAPFSIVGMETKVAEQVVIHTPVGELPIQIGGTIDRMDSKDGILRIVDYKTGGSPKIPETIEQLFTPGEQRPGYIFQTFLYAAILCRKQQLKVAPALLYIHRAASDSYSPVIEMGAPRQPKTVIDDFSVYEKEYRERLMKLLEEIYNPQESFMQTDDRKKCEFCEFCQICGR